jgi:Mg-chelatase subunit ChlD
MRRVFLTLILALLSVVSSLLPRLFPPEKPQPKPAEVQTEASLWVPIEGLDVTSFTAPPVVILVVDSSGSMRGTEARVAEVAARWNDLTGLVTFGDSARMLLEPGTPAERANAVLATLPYRGGSNLQAGLLTAIEWFERHDRGGEIRIVSDGEANVGEVNPQNIYTLRERMVARGIRLTVVESGDPASTILRDLAAATDGQIYAAGSDVR